jgi:hypothetical protein
MVDTPGISFKEFILFVLLGMFAFIFIVLSCYAYFRFIYRRNIVWDSCCTCHTEEYNEIV